MTLDQAIQKAKSSKKYSNTTSETIEEIFHTEEKNIKNTKEAIKSAKKKLHRVVAEYLGDPDYADSLALLKTAYKDYSEVEIMKVCATIMKSHFTTRERLPLLQTFYKDIFEITGKPKTIADFACGISPLSLPWIEFTDFKYYAYDTNIKRVKFLNEFFNISGFDAKAIAQDVMVKVPGDPADVTFILKEIHRMVDRNKVLALEMLKKTNTTWLVVSIPQSNMRKGWKMPKKYEEFVGLIAKNNNWSLKSLSYDTELVFLIKK